MIKIFRKARQQLLLDNKLKKYFFYALGEIVLVVIGILIALQINIYRGNQQNEEVEIEYLKGILNDLDQDIYELNNLVAIDSLFFKSYTIVLNAFQDEQVRNSKELNRAIGMANTTQSFTGNSIVFEDMKSSGKISLIKKDELRFSLLKYYKNSNAIKKVQNESTNPKITRLMTDAFVTNVDLNSLIEKFIFKDTGNAELSDLDHSFFEKDVSSQEVKSFSNRISMMKGLVKLNHRQNNDLLYSAQGLKSKLLDYLESKGVEIQNTLSKELLVAIEEGDVGSLEKLVSKETLDDCFFMEDESGNYLVHGITYKSLASVQYFIESGANIEAVCENKTPLMYAIKYGEFEIVKYLVAQGANLEASNKGKTPLYYAKVYEHPEIEKYLIQKGSK